MLNKYETFLLNSFKKGYDDTQINFFEKNQNEININAIDPESKCSLLTAAIIHNSLSFVSFAIFHTPFIDVNQKDGTGNYPLIMLSEKLLNDKNQNCYLKHLISNMQKHPSFFYYDRIQDMIGIALERKCIDLATSLMNIPIPIAPPLK